MVDKKRQRGVSFFTLILVLAVVLSLGLLGVKAFPTVIEYQAAVKAINKAKEGATVVEVRNIFDRAADIDNITSIAGRDLQVVKNGDQTQVSFAYDKEIHIFGPAYLLLKYEATSRPGR
jgi:hypothetical protein